jgi:hypothetical protein
MIRINTSEIMIKSLNKMESHANAKNLDDKIITHKLIDSKNLL